MELKSEACEPEGRRETHGPFAETADLAVWLALECSPPSEREPYSVQHAREMICAKLARIAKGDPMHEDHWRDIAGYASLVAEWLKSRNAVVKT
jgi:hypothetical protein